ncbi:MAG: SGNH/GDSL hydrolase family protein [Clostridia bacterium]|nr:SGNH/GDSL hydrolase family protein [Clostridia bacterium]
MRLLFQGDSITDAGRDKRNYYHMGKGYPKYAVELIKEAFPDANIEFINQGISGNRTDQLFDRLYPDAIALEPDVISILIGINDIWHRHGAGKIETTDEQIAVNYRAILTRLKAQTNAKIVILSPYLLDCEEKESWRVELNSILPIIRDLAKEFADVYIPLDEIFEEALKTQPEPRFYSGDGVHPNENGSKFIGKLYFDAIAPLLRSML